MQTRITQDNLRRLIYVRDLLRELVVRDMKLRYKRSVLGIAWSILNPLAQLLVFGFVFRFILPVKIPNYSSFLFCGVLAWNWFSSSLLLSTGAIVDNRDLIKRPGFPAAILPTVRVTSDLVHFLLALPVLLVFLMLDGIRLSSMILALPIVIALEFTLILALAYFVSTIHVIFRDTQYLLGVLLHLLFFLTPVFYDVTSIPTGYQALYLFNPMMHVIDGYRAILIRGEFPDRVWLLILGAVAGVLLTFGYRTFSRASYHFVEEL